MKLIFKLTVEARPDLPAEVHALALQAVLEMRLSELDLGITGPVRVTVPRERKKGHAAKT